jgi:hypothetical protein
MPQAEYEQVKRRCRYPIPLQGNGLDSDRVIRPGMIYRIYHAIL